MRKFGGQLISRITLAFVITVVSLFQPFERIIDNQNLQSRVEATSVGEENPSDSRHLNATLSGGQSSLTVVSSAPANLAQGQLNVPMMTATISATLGTDPVTGLVIGRTGTASDGNIAGVSIFKDTNNDGQLDPASDTLLGNGVFSGGIADITFITGSESTSPPLVMFLAYDISAGATVSETVGAVITDATSIKTVATVAGTFPASSSLSTIRAAGSDVVPPTAPGNLHGEVRGWNMVALRWDVSIDDQGGPLNYTVELSSTGSFGRPVYPGVNNAWTDIGLAKSTTYQYRVKATDASGNVSGYSNVATFTTAGAASPLNPHVSRTVFNLPTTCSVCHDLYGPDKQKVRADLTCYTCHDGSGSNYNVRAEFNPASDGNALTPGSNRTSYHEVYTPSGIDDVASDVRCKECHNHFGYLSADGPNYGPRLLKNAYTVATNTEQYCYGCHNSAGDPNAFAKGGLISSTFAASAHKANLPADPTGSGNNVICLNCHGPHASDNQFLVGRSTYTAGGNGTKPLSTTGYGTQYGESNLCLSSGCHDANRTSPRGLNVYRQFMVSSTSHSVVTPTGGSVVGCSNCHGPHTSKSTLGSIVSDPNNTMNIDAYNTTYEKVTFCNTCHDGTPPTYAIDSTTIVPRTVVFPSNQAITSNSGGWSKVTFTTGVGHYDRGYACDRCHSPHGANNPRLVTAAEDTATVYGACLQCHGGVNAPTGAKNIRAALVSTTKHPTLVTSTRHFDTETIQNQALSQRHAECVDCHDPHQAKAGLHTATVGNLPNVLLGVSGLSVTNGVAWTTPTYSPINPITEEYQLCYKCHSSYAYGGNAPKTPSGTFKQTEIGKEFNVNNAGYHWVENDKTATSGFTPRTNFTTKTMTFVGGTSWTKSSPMTCTDCHGSNVAADAEGPHGSNQPFILKGTWSNASHVDSNWTLCFICHDASVYGTSSSTSAAGKTGFSGEQANLHALHMSTSSHGGDSSLRGGCFVCHSAIPHGWSKKALLVEYDDPAPYNNGAKLGIKNWKTSGNWRQSDCSINSRVGDH